jgi:hypothetical protein
MIESLFTPCKNPCPDCPIQGRIRRKAVIQEVRADFTAGMIERNASMRDLSANIAMGTSALLTDEGVMGQEWLDGIAERTERAIETYEDAQAYAQKAKDGDAKLATQLDKLSALNASSAEFAQTCSGAAIIELGHVTLSRCTSEIAPVIGRFGISVL